MVMRCEKGFVSAGFEGDGIVNPFDAGCGWAVDMDKGDFIGRRTLVRDLDVGGVRPSVVGLLPEDPSFVPPDGTPLVAAGAPAQAPPVIGYVSQACHSPNVGRAIALAVLDDGQRLIDERIEIAAIERRGPCGGHPPLLRRSRRRADARLRRWAIGSRSPVPCSRR